MARTALDDDTGLDQYANPPPAAPSVAAAQAGGVPGAIDAPEPPSGGNFVVGVGPPRAIPIPTAGGIPLPSGSLGYTGDPMMTPEQVAQANQLYQQGQTGGTASGDPTLPPAAGTQPTGSYAAPPAAPSPTGDLPSTAEVIPPIPAAPALPQAALPTGDLPSTAEQGVTPIPKQIQSSENVNVLDNIKGARGQPVAALGDDTEHPAVTRKIELSPMRYVALQKQDPGLYDEVTKVAAAVDISPFDLANLIYAQSKNDPAFDQDGRIGLTGITKAEAEQLDPEHHFSSDLQDPVTNLMLGAMKYKNLSDQFGARTPSAIMANRIGGDKVNSLSRMSPEEQKEHGADGFDFLKDFQTGRASALGGEGVSAAPAEDTAEGPSATAAIPPAQANVPPNAPPAAPPGPAPAPAAPAAPAGGTAPTQAAAAPGQPTTQGGAQPGAGTQAPISPATATDQGQPKLTSSGAVSPLKLVQAGLQGGPQGFMTYMTHSMPAGMNMSDQWRAAQAKIVGAFVAKGDMVGAQRAAEFVFQMSHVGANQSLMQAYRMLRVGDNNGAAHMLAKAYSFVPDGGTMTFQATSNGIFGQRYSEDTGQPIGNPFQITPQGVAGMLNQTMDPQTFLKTNLEEQKAISDINHKATLDRYYDALPGMRQDLKQAELDTRIATNANTQESANARAVFNAQARQRDTFAAHENEVAKDVATNYPTVDIAGQPLPVTPQQAQESGLFGALRRQGMFTPQAKEVASGITANRYNLQPMSDGSMRVVDPSRPNIPLATIPAGTVSQLRMAPATNTAAVPAAPAAPQSPIGATPTGVRPSYTSPTALQGAGP
jgi:hypothetical protein